MPSDLVKNCARLAEILICASIAMIPTRSQAAAQPFLYGLSGSNIIAYAADGTSTQFASTLQPDALAFNPSGNLFASLASGYVVKYAANGSSSLFASGYSATDGLAIDSSGNVYVAQTSGQNNIYKITPQGVSSLFAHLTGAPNALAFDFAGNLYASVDNSIEKFDSLGTQSTFVTGLASPRGIVFDPSGDLYVANDLMTNGNVQEYSPAGTLIKTVASGLPTPYSVALDNTGDLFIGNLAGPTDIVEITAGGTTSNFATYTYGGGALVIAPAYAPTIPEPASAATLTLVGTMLLTRRRSASSRTAPSKPIYRT